MAYQYLRFFREIGIDDLPSVGGKNASLGEMYQKLSSQGVRVPNGFAYFTTSKSIFSTIPTVLGVVSYLLGLPIPKEAVPTGIPVEQENSPVS